VPVPSFAPATRSEIDAGHEHGFVALQVWPQPDMLLSMAISSSDLRELARRGAAHRYRELQEEMAALVQHFPDLAFDRRSGSRRAGGAGAASDVRSTAADAIPPTARRRGMSAAARKAVSQRMKRYWAERRKSKADRN